MRKLFSLIAAVLFAGSMMADSYVKVTSAPTDWSGDYLIVYETGNVAFNGGLDALDAAENTIAVAITDGAIEANATTDAAKFTIAAIEGGYSIQSASGKFIGQTTYANGLKAQDAAIAHALSLDADGNAVLAVSVDNSGTPAEVTLRFNDASNQLRFRYYKTGQKAIQLYKRNGGSVTPPQPTCTLSDFLGNGSGNAAYDNRFKVCLPEGVSVVNIQSSFGTEAGIYLTFPSADFGTISLDAAQYATQGAGMLLYVSAFLNAAETEVTVVCGEVTYTITVINANPETTPVVLPDPTNCAEAREAALSVAENNALYKDGAVYSITGYVTSIQTAYSDQHNNISFWMADAADGGNVIQAYRAACATAEDAPVVGDKVTVTGSLTKYGTTPEFAAGCTFVIVEHTTVLPVNLGEKTIAEFLALANTLDTCVITGVVANIKKNNDGSYNKYGNFDLVDGEASVYVYGLLTAAGEAQKFQEMGVDEGDTLTVKAVYSLYNDAVQAKNAVFVAVKKAAVVPGEEINVTISSLTTPGQVFYVDVVAYYGYWDFYAYNDEYEVEVSNISTTVAEGTYTIDELDADYTYILPAEGDTVHFTAGQVVLSITDGVVNLAGQLTGDDNNIYNINLTYKDPVAEQTVNVTIDEATLYDAYADYGLYAVYGSAADETYVQLAIWADDLDNQYVGSGLVDAAGNTQQIYAAAITVTPGAIEGAYTITADLLCYNNTLYKATMKIGEEQGIDNVDDAVKAFKSIINGQMIIEKNNVRYNANGAVVR